MKVNSEMIKELRNSKRWSQEQLGSVCGLNLRTIQRLENDGKASLESIRSLAAVFEIDSDELILSDENRSLTPLEAIKTCFFKCADFSNTASQSEYWWFFLFVLLVAAVATIISPNAYQTIGVLALLPLISVGTRRLRDVGRSGWWQLLFLVPFGQVVVFFLLAQESQHEVRLGT